MMTLTKKWINKQINEYETLINHPDLKDETESVKRLKNGWQVTINTLKATLEVIELEINQK
jgi:hypothetical protein